MGIISPPENAPLYNNGENWAVLACGSKGYTNYRHQADAFHVYQSLIKRGFSKNHIILFAYDFKNDDLGLLSPSINLLLSPFL